MQECVGIQTATLNKRTGFFVWIIFHKHPQYSLTQTKDWQKTRNRPEKTINMKISIKKTHTQPKDWQGPFILKIYTKKKQQKQATPLRTPKNTYKINWPNNKVEEVQWWMIYLQNNLDKDKFLMNHMYKNYSTRGLLFEDKAYKPSVGGSGHEILPQFTTHTSNYWRDHKTRKIGNNTSKTSIRYCSSLSTEKGARESLRATVAGGNTRNDCNSNGYSWRLTTNKTADRKGHHKYNRI